MSTQRRALHYVLKVANLKRNLIFFRDQLGMKVLRHEEFSKGCEAACNGPYDGKWSKTMIGYGSEDDHFVLELTYNYTIGKYNLGNDLQHITLGVKKSLFDKAKKELSSDDDETKQDGDRFSVRSPDGYKFTVVQNKDDDSLQDIREVCLSCRDLKKSLKYWADLLKMESSSSEDSKKEATLRYAEKQATLRLLEIDEEVDHKSAYGRIAFSCPSDELKPLQKAAEDADYKILTPFVSLDTPGKATVEVVILADPDGHEICFVGDEGFRELSKMDPKANELIEKSIEEDKSDDWYKSKKKAKVEE